MALLRIYNREPWKVQELLEYLVQMQRDGWSLVSSLGNPVVLDSVDPIGFSKIPGYLAKGYIKNIAPTVKDGGCFPNMINGYWYLRR